MTRAGDVGSSLTVYYSVEGTAGNGADYVTLPGLVTLPAGAYSQAIMVAPIPDELPEGEETVVITFLADAAYQLGAPPNATVTILDKPFDGWRYRHFGPQADDPAVAGELADPDADGILNLLEYALHLDPNVPDIDGLWDVSVEDGYLQLRFQRVRPPPADINNVGQVSGDLITWCGASCTVTQVLDNADGTETVSIRDTVTFNEAVARFIRLKVVRDH